MATAIDYRSIPIFRNSSKCGTVIPTVVLYFRFRHSSSAPFGGTFPPGEGIVFRHPNKFQLIGQRIKFDKHIRKTDSSIGARFYRSNRR